MESIHNILHIYPFDTYFHIKIFAKFNMQYSILLRDRKYTIQNTK